MILPDNRFTVVLDANVMYPFLKRDILLRFFEANPLEQRPVVVAHELTQLSRNALLSGLFDAVLSQDTGHLVRSAVRIMRAKSDRMPIYTAQERIRIDVYLKENMPL